MGQASYTAVAGTSDCKETMIRLLPTSFQDSEDQIQEPIMNMLHLYTFAHTWRSKTSCGSLCDNGGLKTETINQIHVAISSAVPRL